MEATLKEQLARTDAERAEAVGRLKHQQEELTRKISTLVGRCTLTVSKPVLKAPAVSALDSRIPFTV